MSWIFDFVFVSYLVDFHGAVFCKQRVESLGLFVKPPSPHHHHHHKMSQLMVAEYAMLDGNQQECPG